MADRQLESLVIGGVRQKPEDIRGEGKRIKLESRLVKQRKEARATRLKAWIKYITNEGYVVKGEKAYVKGPSGELELAQTFNQNEKGIKPSISAKPRTIETPEAPLTKADRQRLEIQSKSPKLKISDFISTTTAPVYNKYGIKVQEAKDPWGGDITPLTSEDEGTFGLQIGTRGALRTESGTTNVGPVVRKQDVQNPADFNQQQEIQNKKPKSRRTKSWRSAGNNPSQDQIAAAQKFLDREGPGGPMTSDKMIALNLVDAGGTGTYQTRITRNYFRDHYTEG